MNDSHNFMKFGEMPWGTHFTDGRRKFIKIQTHSACGVPYSCQRKCNDTFFSFNSIDYSGIPATCPEWLSFEIITVDEKI